VADAGSSSTKIFVDFIIRVEQRLQSLMFLLVTLFQFPDLSSIKHLDGLGLICNLPLFLQRRFVIVEIEA
jgi:hypothetical protein